MSMKHMRIYFSVFAAFKVYCFNMELSCCVSPTLLNPHYLTFSVCFISAVCCPVPFDYVFSVLFFYILLIFHFLIGLPPTISSPCIVFLFDCNMSSINMFFFSGKSRKVSFPSVHNFVFKRNYVASFIFFFSQIVLSWLSHTYSLVLRRKVFDFLYSF